MELPPAPPREGDKTSPNPSKGGGIGMRDEG